MALTSRTSTPAIPASHTHTSVAFVACSVTGQAFRSGGFECDGNDPILDRRSGDSYPYGFLLTGDFHLCLSELFSLTIGVELKRMGSEQEWRRRPADLFLSGAAQKDGGV